ncbi:MAG: SpaA isopeptide-forming pilin-related protein [Suipraeoptans sp.]
MKKVDSFSSTTALNGVKFGIYSDASATTKVGEMTSGSDGIATSPILSAGTNYYLKEISTINGYLLSDTIYGPYSFSAGTEKAYSEFSGGIGTITNDKSVSMTISKYDSVTKDLITSNYSSFKFQLYDAATGGNAVGTEQTLSSNGTVTFSGLKPNTTYYIEETSVASSYILPTTRFAITTPNYATNGATTGTSSINNDRRPRISIYKTTDMDTQTTEPMAGVKFDVYEVAKGTTTFVISEATKKGTTNATNASGTVEFDSNLLSSNYTYFLVEVLSGDDVYGYTAKTVGPINLAAGANQGTAYAVNANVTQVDNTADKGKFKIKKVSATSATTNLVATFDVLDSNKQPVVYPTGHANAGSAMTITTGSSDGIGESFWLAAGTYYLRETSVTGDYTVGTTDIEVTVTKGKTDVTLVDTPITNAPKGELIINKKSIFNVYTQAGESVSDSKTIYDLTGMSFKIYVSTGSANKTSDLSKDPVQMINMTSNASATSMKLDAGKYWIEEIVPVGSNYVAIPVFEVTLAAGESLVVENPASTGLPAGDGAVYNVTSDGKIRIFKTDLLGNALTNQASFELYIVDNTNGTEYTINNNPVKLSKVTNPTSSASAADDYLYTGTAGTNQALSKDIPAGTYYLKEISAPLGYEILNEWTGPIIVKEGGETQVTVKNNPLDNTGVKFDSTGNPLAGAYIGAFKSKEDAEAFRTLIFTSYYDISTGKVKDSFITKLLAGDFDSYLYTYAVTTTASGGNIPFIKPFEASKTYYIMEITAPTNFAWDSSIHEVTTGTDGLIEDTLTITNYPGWRIFVQKNTIVDGETVFVNGVEFNVYQAISDDSGEYVSGSNKYIKGAHVATGVSGSNGTGGYISIQLPQGMYIIEENTSNMPNGIAAPSSGVTYKVIELNTDSRTIVNENSTPDATFTNDTTYTFFKMRKVKSDNLTSGQAVTFTLQKKNESGVYVNYYYDHDLDSETAPIIYTVTTITSGYVSSILLPLGDYRLIEGTVPAGYERLPDDALQFTLEAGVVHYVQYSNDVSGAITINTNETKTDDIVVNKKQGNLTLKKEGWFKWSDETNDQEKLADLAEVGFSLYKAPDSADSSTTPVITGTAAYSGTTGSGGTLTISNINTGKYWLVETSNSNTGYSITNPVVIGLVTIDSGQTNSYYTTNPIKNYINYGKVKIKKVDSVNGDVLSGVVFGLYTKSGDDYNEYKINNSHVTFTTGDNGIALSPVVPEGTYYVMEKTALANYTASTEIKEVTITGSTIYDLTTSAFRNTKNYKLQFKKTDVNTGSGVAGAIFALFDTQDNATNAVYTNDSAISNLTGIITWGTTAGTDGLWTTETLTPASGTQKYYLKELKAPTGYVLNADVKEIIITYDMITGTTTPTLINLTNGTISNIPKGKVRIQKVGRWQGVDDTETKEIVLSGVRFELYKVSGTGVSHTSGASVDATITTDDNGFAEGPANGLDAGWYEVVEVSFDGYAAVSSKWVEVKDNQTNTSLTGDNKIVNYPNKAKFTLDKYDGSSTATASALTSLVGAKFKLQKKNAEGVYIDVGGADGAIVISKDANTGSTTYESGYLESGDYRLIETQAPTSIEVNGVTISFALDETPIDFKLVDGTTISIKAYNSPNGNIKLTKTGKDAANISEYINVAKFQLLDKDKNAISGTIIDGSVTTITGGVYEWTNLDPGTYYIQEMESSALSALGYAPSTVLKEVVISSGKLISEITSISDITETAEIVNNANQGRILITKYGEDNTTKLAGAVFEIYAKGAEQIPANVLDTVTITEADTGALSKLLPASDTGITYTVKEVKAPTGYTLDERFSADYPLEKDVVVKAYHTPTMSTGSNSITFNNLELTSVKGIDGVLIKQVKNDAFGNEDISKDVLQESTAATSLLKDDYSVNYRLGGFANGDNVTKASEFYITDEGFSLYSLNESGEENIIPFSATNVDYYFKNITILRAVNVDADTEEPKISAEVHVKYKGDTGYTLVNTGTQLNDLSTGNQTVQLDNAGTVIGVKVVYKNVAEGFTTDGVVFNVVFPQRDWSTADDKEVRVIKNNASIYFKEDKVDESGNVIGSGNITSLDSNTVVSYIPSYNSTLPQVSLGTKITTRKSTYLAGDSIGLQAVVTNQVVDNQHENFENIVVSVKMPAYTELVGSLETGFKVTIDGVTLVYGVDFEIIQSTAVPSLSTSDSSGDNSPDRDDLKVAMYTFVFADNVVLEPGQSINIDYTGQISYNRASDINALVTVGYLSSTKETQTSLESPKGISFIPYNNEPLQEGTTDTDIIDNEINEELKYLENTANAAIGETNALRVEKQVSSDGQNYSSLTTAKVNSDGTIYYKITLYNLSSNYIRKASLIDVLPFTGDNYTINGNDGSVARSTNIPTGEGYDGVSYENVYADTMAGVSTTLYYYNNPWTYDYLNTASSETSPVRMLYSGAYMNSWESVGWNTSGSPETSAVGLQVDFSQRSTYNSSQGQNVNGLEPFGSYTFHVEVKAPEFTFDKAEEYEGKLIANSIVAGALRWSAGEEGNVVQSDRVQPTEVLATIELPSGSIGDYVWYDSDGDGIQDNDEADASGINVKLKTTKYYLTDDNSVVSKVTTKTTKTNQDGYYIFEDLACNYPRDEVEITDNNREDPNNYIGNVYYRYEVLFELPSEYTFTKSLAGNNDEVDSNILSLVTEGGSTWGTTERVELTVRDVDGQLVPEHNMTIDAGLVEAFELGDRVWIDYNKNGLQENGEPGLAGVGVTLYNVDSANGTIVDADDYIAKATTSLDGTYLFSHLPAGYYIVRFNISDLRKTGGYTFRYTFTEPNVSIGINNSDSDALNTVGTNDRIKDTTVINLSREGLEDSNLNPDLRSDMRWDAGVVAYSAITGYVFDDEDYDNIQSIGIPLTGTLVELYEYTPSNTIGSLVASQYVARDGSYYFDNLIFTGTEKKYAIKFIYPNNYEGVDPKVGDDDDVDSEVTEFEKNPDGTDNRNIGYIKDVVVENDSIVTKQDAGATLYSAIGDYLWIDRNRNGKQDSEETVIVGRRVVLQMRELDQETGQWGAWTYYHQTETDENGQYYFGRLKSSNSLQRQYRVVFNFSNTTTVTHLNAPDAGKEEDSDAIETYQSNIIPSIITTLESKNLIATFNTLEQPTYSLMSHDDGGYVTQFIKPGYGEIDMTWDAGIVFEKVAVGDYVWYDDDNDGIQDADEIGVENVNVVLEYNSSGDIRNESAWAEIASMKTDYYGKYLFTDLTPGYYRVKFEIPDGYRRTKYNQGNNAELDSDISRVIDGNWLSTGAFYLELEYDLSWDAGIYKPGVRHVRENQTRTRERIVRVANVRTGDSSNLLLWTLVMLGASSTLITLGVKRKRRKNSIKSKKF